MKSLVKNLFRVPGSILDWFIGLVLGLPEKPIGFQVRLSEDRAVFVEDHAHHGVVIGFERRLKPGDVRRGRLVPVAQETFGLDKKKRVTALIVHPDSARALYLALGKALAERRHQQISCKFSRVLWGALEVITSKIRQMDQ